MMKYAGVTVDVIENQIEQLKNKLLMVAHVSGLNSHDTIRCSQKLDEFIVIYQRCLQHSYQKNKPAVKLKRSI